MSEKARRSAAFIAVGSNIEPERHIVAALTALVEKTHVVGSSTFYRTAPVGRVDQPMFVNGLWLIRTDLDPHAVRRELLAPVERLLGRQRSDDKFASRTIDLDLVLYDDRVESDGDLRLPHPDIARPFVCGPILEVLNSEEAAIEPELRGRIARLLPQHASTAPPGEILKALTERLRQLLT